MVDAVRIGVVGIGNMGSRHAKNIINNVDNAKLTAVCDPLDEELATFNEYEDVGKFHNIDELIAAGNVDALIIASPHPNHFDSGMKSLKAGLHTLIEKPLCPTSFEAEQLIDTHKNSPKELVFAEMFNQRTNPAYIKLRDMIQNNELGKIHRITWVITSWFRTQAYYHSSPWRASWEGEGGGVVINQGSHQLDIWQWLFGMPDNLRAHAFFGGQHNIKTPDHLTAIMTYNSGTMGTFIISSGESIGVNRLEIGTDRGLLEVTEKSIKFGRTEVSLDDYIYNSKHRYTHPKNESIEYKYDNVGPQHLGVLRNFADTIQGRASLIAPAVEGIRAVDLQNAMVYSSFTNKTVEVPLARTLYNEFLSNLIEKERKNDNR